MTQQYVTWFQVNEYAEKIAQRISHLWPTPPRIYPIQTVDGFCAALSVMSAIRDHDVMSNACIVDELQDANIILDAVERTGQTKANILQANKGILLFDTLLKAEEEVEYIFPWNTIDPRTLRTNFPIRNTSARNTASFTRIEDKS